MKYEVSVNFCEFCSLFKFSAVTMQALPNAYQNLVWSHYMLIEA